MNKGSVMYTQALLPALTALAELRTLGPGIKYDWSCCIPTLWRLIYHVSYSWNAPRSILPCGRLLHQRLSSITLHSEGSDIYAPSERHMCYTLPRVCSYLVGTYTRPSTVYAFLRPSAKFYLSTIAIYRMLHSPRYVWLWNLVTYYNTVIASDISLAVAFASPLSYFTDLKYTVQSSQSLVLYP